ncbi:MAG: DUF481 domain-containing protein [marine benthic group bacterium]|nr:DUF481 domain-containing protein [Gemmatimonadota bacterium]MCL7982068.1 DUF481 domain-containing protein [Gemmatimonadota bacterium]
MQIHSSAWRLGRWFAGAFALAGLLLAVPGGVGSLSAQEFIIHANGDSINGDVKGFQRGKLEFEIPGGSSTFIEFDDIATIGSSDYWDIEFDDQTRTFGRLAPGSEPGMVRIVTAEGAWEVPLRRIVTLTNLKTSFWSKWDGFLEFGFSFAKANNVTNYTLGARADYRGEHWAGALSLDSRLNSQDDVETTSRNQLALSAFRLFPHTWYAGLFGQAEQNQELDLDLRLLIGVGGGRDIIQSNRVEWRWLAGLLLNRERYTGLDTSSSAEGLLGTYFNFFTFGDWENDIASSLLVYPSLTESGRVRIDFDISYRQDLFSDFYFRLSFYDQYDSRPPEGASKNDFGTTIAVGWDW